MHSHQGGKSRRRSGSSCSSEARPSLRALGSSLATRGFGSDGQVREARGACARVVDPVEEAAALKSRPDMGLHWALAYAVFAIDVALVAATIVFDKAFHVDPPAEGIDTSAAVGWIGVCGAVFAFGSFGILMKLPSVQATSCDCMVFQIYYSVAVCALSLVIWAVAGSSEGLMLSFGSVALGILFATLWTVSQVLGFNAVQAVGYAVAPAVWIGVTICTSFAWGVALGSPVRDPVGAAVALVLMVVGVVLAAASSVISDRARGAAREAIAAHRGDKRAQSIFENVVVLGKSVGISGADVIDDIASKDLGDIDEDEELESAPLRGGAAPKATGADADAAPRGSAAPTAAGTTACGLACAAAMGVSNGSMMVPMSLFVRGVPSLGLLPYTGHILAPLAFSPSMATGIAIAQPLLFMAYWAPGLLRGERPKFHFDQLVLPGMLTGAFWCMGNFCAMYSTVYLGQTVGFPLTQCCLIVCGLWGILYFKEIEGSAAVATFVLSSFVILVGAVLDGLSV